MKDPRIEDSKFQVTNFPMPFFLYMVWMDAIIFFCVAIFVGLNMSTIAKERSDEVITR